MPKENDMTARLDSIDFSVPYTSNRRLLVGPMDGGRSSIIGGPCLSAASWSVLPLLASAKSHEAGLGVNGFGSFFPNKRTSAAGPKPGMP